MSEIWLAIKNHEKTYAISNYGRVKSITRCVRNGQGTTRKIAERILKPWKFGKYLGVTIEGTKYYVHILVLNTFVGPRPPGMLARHFPNRETIDNRLQNLQWATPETNQNDRIIHGTDSRGEKQTNSKLTEKQVLKIRTDPRIYAEIGTQYGISIASVSLIKNKKNWRHI